LGQAPVEHVRKCSVYCTSDEKFAPFNALHTRYFPKDPSTSISINGPGWFGSFEIEIDCIAMETK
jgi:2-iminobutanoate/2-iminopropanoate deaminase